MSNTRQYLMVLTSLIFSGLCIWGGNELVNEVRRLDTWWSWFVSWVIRLISVMVGLIGGFVFVPGAFMLNADKSRTDTALDTETPIVGEHKREIKIIATAKSKAVASNTLLDKVATDVETDIAAQMEEDKNKSIDQRIREFKKEFELLERESPDDANYYRNDYLRELEELVKEQETGEDWLERKTKEINGE